MTSSSPSSLSSSSSSSPSQQQHQHHQQQLTGLRSSLVTIHKPTSSTKSKRLILPKNQLIQFYIENAPSSTTDIMIGHQEPKKVLPKLNNQDVIRRLNFSNVIKTNDNHANTFTQCDDSSGKSSAPSTQCKTNNSASGTSALLASTTTSKTNSTYNKKSAKEKKFKEITRLCLNHSTHRHLINTPMGVHEYVSSNELGHQASENEYGSFSNAAHLNRTPGNKNLHETGTRSKTGYLIQHLAKEFLLECKQRLDHETYLQLLETFTRSISKNDREKVEEPKSSEQLSLCLNDVHRLISRDQHLRNRFSAFLTCEQALQYDLFTQACQYEKCYDFIHMLELLIPNKSTFKKLIQSIISSCMFSNESDRVLSKIDEIKSKLKSVCKNNALVNLELDYLFDQRWANLEPTYEKISLVKLDDVEPLTSPTTDLKTSKTKLPEKCDEGGDKKKHLYDLHANEELVDLRHEYQNDFGTKKCSCNCHLSISSSLAGNQASTTNNQIAAETALANDESTAASSNANAHAHCLLCSLKLIKGRLCIKCEGKKAIPLVYRIYNESTQN